MLQKEEKVRKDLTSTSLSPSEVKFASVKPQPTKDPIRQDHGFHKLGFPNHPQVYVGEPCRGPGYIFSPAIIPSDPSKLCPGEGRHTGGKSAKSTCSPIQQILLIFVRQLIP